MGPLESLLARIWSFGPNFGVEFAYLGSPIDDVKGPPAPVSHRRRKPSDLAAHQTRTRPA